MRVVRDSLYQERADIDHKLKKATDKIENNNSCHTYSTNTILFGLTAEELSQLRTELSIFEFALNGSQINSTSKIDCLRSDVQAAIRFASIIQSSIISGESMIDCIENFSELRDALSNIEIAVHGIKESEGALKEVIFI